MVVTENVSEAHDKGYVWLAEQLREFLASGAIAVGNVLPSMKELGAQHGVSSETARRAARQLVAEGLLSSEPRSMRAYVRSTNPSSCTHSETTLPTTCPHLDVASSRE